MKRGLDQRPGRRLGVEDIAPRPDEGADARDPRAARIGAPGGTRPHSMGSIGTFSGELERHPACEMRCDDTSSVPRNWSTALVWSCDTRDSVSPRTLPTSFMVSSSR
jgi:hypothetical protein